MDVLRTLFTLMIFPGGLFILFNGMVYEWADRKLVARLQNRVGPRWFQPLADMLKLLAKEEVVPASVDARLFIGLPVIALAGVLTAALYLPIAGLPPAYGFPGDLIVTVYMLSLLTLCTGIAGANTNNRFSLVGATRTLTQLFSYEAPFMLAMLGPAVAAGSWQIGEVMAYAAGHPVILTQPVGFVIALIGLMGKLEMRPFDAPEAETEIVAGAMTEYSGRGLALFYLGRYVELIAGLTLVAAFYLGGIQNPLDYFVKTLALLLVLVGLQTLMTRLRIDQTVGLWWRYGTLLVLLQWFVTLLLRS
ncbi:MAG: NADH-quinone oxidoreductase subunit H [Chloroflexi bacterium]|jgi:NADH-quinone oxidoreductase subunit H|nr:NADH-quinone oxidoreductase subunit H [Chloroflexota bacterium]MDL1884552.1 NADH-quinone oxidoreductase subunit H [Anaerolineae bacterium CFX8]GIL13229.1 MAG: hydrogenase [Chloroflexota bacterium]